MSGVSARLLRLDGAAGGVNHHSHQRIGWQLQAAALLRLFMERDGKGSPDKGTEKIANALDAGGINRRAGPTRATNHALLSNGCGKRKGSKPGEMGWYEEALSMMRLLSKPPDSLEKLLTQLTAQIKSEIFLPNVIGAKPRAIRQKRARDKFGQARTASASGTPRRSPR